LFLVSNCPCLNRDIDRIQAILESTTTKLYPSASLLRKGKLCGNDTYTSHPNNYFGYGRIDVAKAVEVCKEFCAAGGNGKAIQTSLNLIDSSTYQSNSFR
jgi:hypothetical protein